MKKALGSFTFCCMLLSLFIIYANYEGQDTCNIVLVHLNLILNKLNNSDFARHILNSGPRVNSNTICESISIYWYFAHFISFIIYGMFIDCIKLAIKKLKQ